MKFFTQKGLLLFIFTFLIFLSNINAQVTVTSVTPATGSGGTTMIIVGTGFSATTTNDAVYFGAAKGNVISASATSLTVQAPTGAANNAVTVINTTTGLAGSSKTFYKPNFGGTSAAPSFTKTTQSAPSGTTTIDVQFSDLDGDGFDDMVVSDNGNNNLLVYKNTTSAVGGTPTFSLATSLSFSNTYGVVRFGDLNRDGKPDIIAGNGSATIGIFINSSSGVGSFTFQSQVSLSLPTVTNAAVVNYSTVCDFDGDGIPDIIAGDYANNIVYIFRNTNAASSTVSAGSFTRSTLASGSELKGVSDVEFADMDGDGKPDMIASMTDFNTGTLGYDGSGWVAIYPNTSTSGSPSVSGTYVQAGGTDNQSPLNVVIADFDGDGKLDLAWEDGSNGTQYVYVSRNTSTGVGNFGLSAVSKYNCGTNTTPTIISVADFNGDGKPDIVAADYTSASVNVLTNGSTSGSLSFSVSSITGLSNNQNGVAAADLNGDSKPDFVSVDVSSITINIFQNTTVSSPVVTVDNATSISSVTATLNGKVFAGTTSANLFFDYGTSPTLIGASSVSASPSSVTIASGNAVISAAITGLTASTTYYFRARATNTNGTTNGSIISFATTAPTNTTWNGSSWSNGNPSSTIDAIVSDVSNTAPASFSCKNLTINSGAALNITGITATINGNITNSGNGISGTGTLTIAATCSVTGNFFTFSGIINLSSGTFTTTGRITIAPGGAITGTYSNLSGSVALQQNIVAQRGWRMFAHPFTTAQTFASIAGANNITIQTTGSSNAAGIADTRLFSNSSNAWVDAGTSPTANTAYGLFIRGITTDITGGGTGLTYSAGPTAFTYTVSGTLNTGNYTVPAPSNAANFTLVGNPFAAPVNSSELTNGTGVSYYVYQIAVTGDGRTKAGSWSTVLSSSATTPIPVLGVIAWKPSSSYTIHTSGINTSNAATTGLFGVETPIPHIELQVEQNGNQQDNFFVRLDPAATANGTDKIDLDKFYNDNVNVYSITTDNTRLAVDARNVLNTIPLGISAVAGDYNFKLADNNLPQGTTVYLNDKYLNTQTALKVGDTYPFTISSDASTKGEQRFELSFSSKTTSTANDPPRSLTANVLGNITGGNLIAVQIAGATTPVTIAVKDMNGKALGTMNAANGIQYVNVGNTAKGMLLLQISDGKSSIIKKVMKL